MFRKIKHLHFVGIGGAGMSGIAEVLMNLGYRVTGSDLSVTETTKRLEKAGGKVFVGHDPSHIQGAQVVVVSSAIGSGNCEIETARRLKIPVIPRAEMLAELMRLKYGIAVAGSHGKTTTTSMIASVLAMGGLDPTAVIGGKLNLFGSHAKLGQGDFLVAEADESDGSFLKLSPTMTVVTNIDREHLEYYHDLEEIKKVFLEFMNKVPFYGCSIICLDEKPLQTMIPLLQKRHVSYGVKEMADIRAETIEMREWRSSFEVVGFGRGLGTFCLKVPGLHNIQNALASIAVGIELEIEVSLIRKALQEFSGVDRRFHLLGERKGIMVVDDYGHHPTEIRATLAAAKQGWNRRVVVLFQPHRFTRTRDLLEDFGQAFDHADLLFLTEIYGAGEKPIPGVSSENLFHLLKKTGHPEVEYLPRKGEWVKRILPKLKENDLVIILGAGDIWKAGQEIYQCLS
ncbi:MAG: UDP-N-acetylmuramate--L-alanine ligase [Nitrospirae bacterium]|nr:UDP-N-acetylmuramate--L-alanine ligase [Nitrospirota bacterium]MBI3351246.1 UDP-N-acetylmuramate--L-alanine ligase [Nitrospirota bacterium]